MTIYYDSDGSATSIEPGLSVAYTVTTSSAIYVPWKAGAQAVTIQATPGQNGTLTVATTLQPAVADLSTLTYVPWTQGTAGAVSSATQQVNLPATAFKLTAGTATGIVAFLWLKGIYGNTLLNGDGAPGASTGANGDFYLNTTTHAIYGPKTGGDTWGSGTTLIGAAGAAGAAGNTVLSGVGVPTTVGVNGDFYINTTTWDIYGPKTGGGWGDPTSLIGPSG